MSHSSPCPGPGGNFIPGRNPTVPWSGSYVVGPPSRNPISTGNSGCNPSTTGTGGTFQLTISPNVGLTLNGFNLSTRYNTTISDSEQSVAVGGAASQAASVWKSKTLVQVLDAILFPELQPTYILPTISLLFSESGIKEIGSPLSQALTLSGVKNDAGAFTSLTLRRNSTQISSVSSPSGSATTSLPSQYGYADPNNPNYSYSLVFTDTTTVAPGTTNWSGTGNYGVGLPKKTSKNVTDSRPPNNLSQNAPQAGGSLTSPSTTVTGIYPYFWGKSSSPVTAADVANSIAAGFANKVVASSSGTINATFDASAEYIWFAHPASDTTKTKWFNTTLNQGFVGTGQFILAPITQSVDSPNSYWSGVSYKVYVSSYATTTVGSVQLLNS